MIDLNIEYLLIGFLFTLFFTQYVYMKYTHIPLIGPRLTFKSRSELRLTEADAEIMNVIAFVKLCSYCMPEKAYRSFLAHKLRTDVDRDALNTLVSLGVCQEHAQFICNYFLAQNLRYPGDLIVLSSRTPFYIYSRSYSRSLKATGSLIYELWKVQRIIEDKAKVYFYE